MTTNTGTKEYLYHGSPIKTDILKPSQAYDFGFEEGCQLAVYATTNKNMAICFALGCVNDSEDVGIGNAESPVEDDPQRIMMPEYGDKMLFRKCHPNYGAKGYLYVLDKSRFTHAMGSQWVCHEEIIPEEVIEINVDDYLDLCIIES